jgi:hypothetical protein
VTNHSVADTRTDTAYYFVKNASRKAKYSREKYFLIRSCHLTSQWTDNLEWKWITPQRTTSWASWIQSTLQPVYITSLFIQDWKREGETLRFSQSKIQHAVLTSPTRATFLALSSSLIWSPKLYLVIHTVSRIYSPMKQGREWKIRNNEEIDNIIRKKI